MKLVKKIFKKKKEGDLRDSSSSLNAPQSAEDLKKTSEATTVSAAESTNNTETPPAPSETAVNPTPPATPTTGNKSIDHSSTPAGTPTTCNKTRSEKTAPTKRDNTCGNVRTGMTTPENEPAVEEDSPRVVSSYASIPVLEQTKLPRGGLSVETKAVGRVQVSIVAVRGVVRF